MEDANSGAGQQASQPLLGMRIPRRRFLQVAGASAAAVVSAHSALAGRMPGADLGPTAEALGQDAIDALAASLDYDLERIFRFVADEIWYEPYAGALRGARGTLESRAGNASDQALLLDALLRASFMNTRFVEGALDPAAESAILRSVAIPGDLARTRAEAIATEPPPGKPPRPAATGPLPPELQEIADLAPELSAAATGWISERLDRNVQTIVEALGGAGIELRAPTVAIPPLERDRHVWVQVQRGAEWLDLDPSVAGGSVGAAAGTPSGDPLAVFPDDLRHRVRVTVSADVISGDTLKQQPVIDHEVFTDALGVAPMLLLHEKPDGLKGLGIAIGAALGEGGGFRYQAILDLGDDVVVGETWLSMRAGDGGVFGTGSSGRDGVTVAEWLDLTVTSPDGTVRSVRRPVFDLVGADARAGGTLDVAAIPEPRLVSITSAEADEFLPLRDLWFLSTATGATSLDGLDGVGEPDDEVAGVGLNAALYHLARDAMSSSYSLDRGVRTFLDGPNVTAYVVSADLTDDDAFAVSTRTDLLHRALATLPVSDRTAMAPPGVVAGVLGHLAERVQSGEGFGDLLPATEPFRPPVSAGGIIESAIDQGIALRVLRGSPPPDLAWPAPAAAHLAASLADGWVAIAPARPVTIGGAERTGWWLVDPATGITIDQLDDGGGAVMAEYSQRLRYYAHIARTWFCLGLGVAERLHLIHDLIHGHLLAAAIGAAAGAGLHRLACH